MFSVLKIFTLFGIVSAWSEKALEDGKITLTEAAELAESLAPLLGVPVDVHIPFPVTPQLDLPEAEEDETSQDGSISLNDLNKPPGSGPDRSNLV